MERQFIQQNQPAIGALSAFCNFPYCMIFNNQLRSFVYLALYAIQDRMRLMQRKTKFGQTQKEICFHNFESESN